MTIHTINSSRTLKNELLEDPKTMPLFHPFTVIERAKVLLENM